MPVTEVFLDELREVYDASGDPLVLWQAYQVARIMQGAVVPEMGDANFRIPEWILQGFDRINTQISNFQVKGFGKRDWKQAIAAVFGFPAFVKGGKTNPFVYHAKVMDDVTLALRVRLHVADGQKADGAYYLVAQTTGIPETTIRNAWKKYQCAVRKGRIDEQRQAIASADFLQNEADRLGVDMAAKVGRYRMYRRPATGKASRR